MDKLLLTHPLTSPPQSLSQAARLCVARSMSPTLVQPSRGPQVYCARSSSMDPALAASSSFVPEQDVIMEEVVSPDLLLKGLKEVVCDKTRDEPLRVTDRGHGEWS